MVYPHRCGGTIRRRRLYRPTTGLSPQVWGNLMIQTMKPQNSGSIPTGVGEPTDQHRNRVMLEVYPHRCGGTPFSLVLTKGNHGLSPQVWGNHSEKGYPDWTIGSIPTGVGEPIRDQC